MLTFLIGLILGAGIVLLFTTERGGDIRRRIVLFLDEKGIKLSNEELDQLIEALKNQNKPTANKSDNYGAAE